MGLNPPHSTCWYCCWASMGRSKQMSKVPYKAKLLVQGHNMAFQEEAGSRGTSNTGDQKTRTVSTCLNEHRSGAKKTREEIQHKEFWGPQDPPLSEFFM